MSKLEVFLWVTRKHEQKKYIISYKLAQGRVYNTMLTLALYYCILFTFSFLIFINQCLTKCYTYKSIRWSVLYKNGYSPEHCFLLKLQPSILTKIESLRKYFCSYMITAANYQLFWGALLSKTLLFIYLFILVILFTCLFIHLFIYLFTYFFIYLLVYLFNYFFLKFIYLFIFFLEGRI